MHKRWTHWVIDHPALVAACFALLTAASAWLAATQLRVDGDTDALLSAELAWRQRGIELNQRFPLLDRQIVALIDAPIPEAADATIVALQTALRQRPDLYTDDFSASTEPLFRRNALLYLTLDELRDTAVGIDQAQALLGRLALDPSSRGVFNRITELLEQDDAVLRQPMTTSSCWRLKSRPLKAPGFSSPAKSRFGLMKYARRTAAQSPPRSVLWLSSA